MPTIRDSRFELSLTDDGADVTLVNRATGSRWTLDATTALADRSGATADYEVEPTRPRGNAPSAVPWESGSVERRGDHALVVTRRSPAGVAAFLWELAADGVRVTLMAGRTTVTVAALPGAFRPEGVSAPAVALPKNQGVWHRGTGRPFRSLMYREGHAGYSMPFFAVVGARDALLTVIEEEADARIWFEKAEGGRVIASAVADPSLGRLRYDRSVVMRFVAPDAASVCASYRQYVKDRGRLVTWEEKVAARPLLERLFGALMCFVGYCQDESLDYAASLKTLKRMGFDRAFVYPLCFGNVVEGFPMGGRPPIDIRRHLGLVESLGYLSAAWMWSEDVPDNGVDVVHDREGRPHLSWQIDAIRWFRACPVRQVPLSNRLQDERMSGFTGHHFDVVASRDALECFHPDHPLDRRDDAVWRRKVLATATRRGLVVSSEGFWGSAAPDYDIGSVKIPTPVHDDWYTVPMTALVYHDSLVHDWWEVDNYNNPHHRSQGGRGERYFPLGGGWQRLQAAQDALAGQPPNVMPFGSQYAFVGGQMSKGTELYRYTLDSPEVKEALALALPVARLHGRVGRVAMVGHETLAADGSLQATTFADGTRVAANYSKEPREVPGFGLVEGEGWKAV